MINEVTLRPYQREAVDMMVGRGKVLLSLTMGAGKTVSSIAAIEELVDNGAVSQGLIFVPSALKYQWQDEIKRFTGLNALVIDGTKAQRAKLYRHVPRFRYTILNYEVVVGDDWKIVRDLDFDFIIVDECFPAGTLVDTPSGPVPVEVLSVGDEVLNAVGVGYVRRTGSRVVGDLVDVVLRSGEVITCTPNHKFFTTIGWQEARFLRCGQEVVRRDEALRMVRSEVSGLSDLSQHCYSPSNWAVLREELFGEVEDESTRTSGECLHARSAGEDCGGQSAARIEDDFWTASRTRAKNESGVDRSVEGETAADLEGQWKYDHGSSGQRDGAYSGRTSATQLVTRRMGLELRCFPRKAYGRLSHQLQVGYGSASGPYRRRSRRAESSGEGPTSSGPQEGRSAGVARVVSVSSHQCRSVQGSQCRCGGSREVRVYNIEVSGHPSYSVEGLLVHNCTALKGFTATRSKRIKFLGKRSDVNIALTGQPIENKAEELFSIMEFVDPTVLGDFRVFDRAFIVRDHYGRAVRFRNLDKIHAAMQDCFYRKTRAEIADQFPRVMTSLLPVRLSAHEERLYRQAAEYTLAGLEQAATKFGGGFDINVHYGRDNQTGEQQRVRGEIMSGMLAMRLICDDPNLLRRSALNFDRTEGKTGSKLASSWLHAGRLDSLSAVSSKRAMLLDRLGSIFDEDPNNKVVVFSTFKGMIAAVQADTTNLTGSVQFTGDMNARQKRDAMRQFKGDARCRLFLSSDAGGYGVDLPEANYLISLDIPWSTGKTEQREGRIIRISSEWEHVDIVAMLAADSIEMWIYNMIEQKRGVSSAFLDGGHDDKGTFTPSLQSLTKFLSENL